MQDWRELRDVYVFCHHGNTAAHAAAERSLIKTAENLRSVTFRSSWTNSIMWNCLLHYGVSGAVKALFPPVHSRGLNHSSLLKQTASAAHSTMDMYSALCCWTALLLMLFIKAFTLAVLINVTIQRFWIECHVADFIIKYRQYSLQIIP